MDKIKIIIPVCGASTILRREQVNHIQSMVTQYLLDQHVADPSKVGIYSVKIEISVEDEEPYL